MSKILSKKNLSNVVFIVAVALLIYPPTRVWFLRQIAFSPSVIKAEKVEKLDTYNWSLKGINTVDINLIEFKNEVVFVNFWATWCPPCRAEMPMIQKLYDSYEGKVKFILVTNESASKVEEYFQKNNFNLPVYNSISKVPVKFSGTNSIPASYLIDKEGNIIISKTGAANWNSKKVRILVDDLLVK